MSNVIESNLSFLCSKTTSLIQILAILLESHVITEPESDAIKNGTSSFESFFNLYSILSKKLSNTNTYESLLKALTETKQQHVVFKLNTFLSSVEQSTPSNHLPVPATALSIFDVSKTPISVNIKAINSVLAQTGDMPIAIFSINGPSRSGKSFLLNYFLEGLRRLNRNTDETDGVFEWKGGSDRVTIGITLWSKPFVVPTDDGLVAVLLIDNQGLFDKETTYRQNSIIFTISSYFSTLMMYNQHGLVLEDVLQNIQCFSNLTRNIANEFGNETSTRRLDLPSKLLLLLRDFEMSEYEYGMHTFQTTPPKGKQNYLRDLLVNCGENKRVRDKLLVMYPDIAAFLLPDPGRKFRREIKLTPNSDFKEHAQSLVNCVLSNTKLITRSRKECQQILESVAAVCEKSSKYFLNARSMEELISINEHMSALYKFRILYQNLLREFITCNPDGATEEALSNASLAALQIVEKEFGYLKNHKTEYESYFYAEKQNMIADVYENVQQENYQKCRAKEIKEKHKEALEKAEKDRAFNEQQLVQDWNKKHEEAYQERKSMENEIMKQQQSLVQKLKDSEMERQQMDEILRETQLTFSRMQVEAAAERESREAKHHETLLKQMEEAKMERAKRDAEIHHANLALAASQQQLSEIRKRASKRNLAQRVFGW